MGRQKYYLLKLTKSELETVQRLLELAASDASPAGMVELERIDSRVYALLFPDLVQDAGPPKLHKPERVHPMPLRTLKIVRE